MEKTAFVEEKEIGLRASALLPKIYRSTFNSDLMVDLQKLKNDITSVKQNENGLYDINFEIFNQITYAMAYNYDKSIPKYDEWLDQFESPFALLNILDDVLELWGYTNKTTSTPIKEK